MLKSVSRKGSNKVVFNFKSPAAPYFYYVAGQTPIVPKHIWSKIANPVKYSDKAPVGSGPYAVRGSTCNAQRIIYTKNTHYWQKGKPKIDTVVYPAYTDNSPANVALATGQDQWGGQFIPNIKTFYTSKSKDNHYWFPPRCERLDLHQPQEPDPQERRCSARDGVCDQPPARREARRVRLRASGQPDRDRVAHVQELAEQEAREEGRL